MATRQTSTRAGRYVQQPSGYSAFIPSDFPPRDLQFDSNLQLALSKADRALARLDGAASVLPDVDLFVRMYVLEEATRSSQIEGTQATLVDVLEADEDEGQLERRDAVLEIRNYVDAMHHGFDRLASLSVSHRLVKEIHKALMSGGVRGSDQSRTPGEFRRSQNWIGGSSPSNARFVPPPVVEMDEALDQWERSVHSDSASLAPLVHIGLLHAQFETIHPFLDGNGRVGRLLITFLLTERGVLAQPLLSLSIFFRQNQDEYYSRLQATRDSGEWEEWLIFFLDGVSETATSATARVQSILQLRERDRTALNDLGRKSGNAMKLLDRLFSQPFIQVKAAQQLLEISQPTANSLIADLERIGVLYEWTGRRRNRSWVYRDYLNIFRPDGE